MNPPRWSLPARIWVGDVGAVAGADAALAAYAPYPEEPASEPANGAADPEPFAEAPLDDPPPVAWAAALGDDDPLLGALDLDEDDCEELGDPVGSETGGTGTEGTETVGTGTGGTGTEGTETVGVERGDA